MQENYAQSYTIITQNTTKQSYCQKPQDLRESKNRENVIGDNFEMKKNGVNRSLEDF